MDSTTSLDDILRPITKGRKYSFELIVSLRGSLATHVFLLREAGANTEARDFIRGLASKKHPHLTYFVENGELVIGLTKERGNYPPEW